MMLTLKVGCLLLLCLFTQPTAAQTLSGKVYTIDDKGDTTALYMARLQWKNTAVGTYTNPKGNFRLPFAQTDTLIVSYSFYQPDTLIISRDQKQVNIFINSAQSLKEVVVSKRRKPKYTRKGNPAVELVEKVIAHKDEHRIESDFPYRSTIYKKMVMSFGRFELKAQKNRFYRQFAFLEKYIDTIPFDSVPALTISLRESLADYYYQPSPQRKVTYVTARRMQGADEVLDSEGLGTNLEAMFSEVNIFDNDIELMLNRFVSPLSSAFATLYYHYFITDTVEVDSVRCIELSFAPVNSRTFGFTGRLYIVNDSTYALKKYAINVPVNINMNYVRQLRIEQEFMQMDNGLWAPKTSQTFATFSLIKRKKARQLYVTQNTLWYDYSPGTAIPDSLSAVVSGDELESADVWKYKSGRWKKMRPLPLSAKESFIDSLSTELRRLPLFKALEKTAEIVATGYIATSKERKQSRFDIGPIYNMISYNPMEGWRFRVGGMTTAKLHDQVFVNGYLAFGCRDLRLKYSLTTTYSFVKKTRHLNESPKHALSFTASYDVEFPGQTYSYMDRDNLLMSFTTGDPIVSAQYVNRYKLRYIKEWQSRFSIDTWLQYEYNEPAGTLAYFRINPGGTVTQLRSFHDTEWGVKLRWAPGELVYNNQSGKENLLTLSKNAPVLQLTHVTGILDFDWWYHRTELSIEKRFWLSAFGYIDASLQGGIVWTPAPFPKLFIPPNNQSIFLTSESFNMMKSMEFLMDKYVSLYATYHLKGWIFNRIPFWNRLKLREVVSFSGVYGGLSPKNVPTSDTPGLYVLPVGCAPIGKVPYMEITAGIENILQVLRIDYVRRLTYTKGLSGWGKNGIRISIDIAF
jgi:hypothetical protein